MLDTENFRFEPSNSQFEAINKMIENQGEKLYNLALDILENGLNPTDMIIVTPSEGHSFRVLEGNRRITTLKLLKTPTLIDLSYGTLQKRFQKLHDKYKNNLLSSVECCVFDNVESAFIWVQRKHSGEQGGIGTVTWNSQQKQRFEAATSGKQSIPLQIISFLASSDEVPNEIKENLPNINITNLDRLTSDAYVREFLGIETNEGIVSSKLAKSEVVKSLVSIVNDILNPEFKVNRIYRKKDREKYIDEKKTSVNVDYNNVADNPWAFSDVPNSQNPTSKNKSERSPTKEKSDINGRRTLIPKSFKIVINNPKAHAVFQELKSMDVTKYTNACAVMMRVLVESSVDVYIDTMGLLKSGALTSSASGRDLKQKVNDVIQYMTNKNLIDKTDSKGIKTAVKDDNCVFSIDSLNGYVHNYKFTPIPENLIIGWDNIEGFFSLLWNNINNKKQEK